MVPGTLVDLEVGEVADDPRLGYSMTDVMRAGDALRTKLIWLPETEADIIQAFAIASDWRATHHWPLRKLRHELIGFMNNLTIAANAATHAAQGGDDRSSLDPTTLAMIAARCVW